MEPSRSSTTEARNPPPPPRRTLNPVTRLPIASYLGQACVRPSNYSTVPCRAVWLTQRPFAVPLLFRWILLKWTLLTQGTMRCRQWPHRAVTLRHTSLTLLQCLFALPPYLNKPVKTTPRPSTLQLLVPTRLPFKLLARLAGLMALSNRRVLNLHTGLFLPVITYVLRAVPLLLGPPILGTR